MEAAKSMLVEDSENIDYKNLCIADDPVAAQSKTRV